MRTPCNLPLDPPLERVLWAYYPALGKTSHLIGEFESDREILSTTPYPTPPPPPPKFKKSFLLRYKKKFLKNAFLTLNFNENVNSGIDSTTYL